MRGAKGENGDAGGDIPEDSVIYYDGNDTPEGYEDTTPPFNSFTELTQTLTAGQTSLSFVNELITVNSTYDIYSSAWGVMPDAVSVINGELDMTFTAQAADVTVKLRIWG